jgi:hypothetical protein
MRERTHVGCLPRRMGEGRKYELCACVHVEGDKTPKIKTHLTMDNDHTRTKVDSAHVERAVFKLVKKIQRHFRLLPHVQ